MFKSGLVLCVKLSDLSYAEATLTDSEHGDSDWLFQTISPSLPFQSAGRV